MVRVFRATDNGNRKAVTWPALSRRELVRRKGAFCVEKEDFQKCTGKTRTFNLIFHVLCPTPTPSLGLGSIFKKNEVSKSTIKKINTARKHDFENNSHIFFKNNNFETKTM